MPDVSTTLAPSAWVKARDAVTILSLKLPAVDPDGGKR